MILYLGLTAVTVAAACFVNNRVTVQPHKVSRQQLCNRILTAGIFTLLFAVSALRTGVGNDYGEYEDFFTRISEHRHVSSEWGFNLVVKAVQFLMGNTTAANITIFGIFAFATIWLFMRAVYEQSDWYVWSFFLFMTNGYYFLSMNSVRYYFALAAALYAMKYALRERWLPFTCWIVFAAFFHKSVLFVLPVYWLAMRRWKKWHIVLGLGLCGFVLLFKNVCREIIFFFYPYYENSMFDNGATSPANIAKCLCVLLLCLLYYKNAVKDNRKVRFYFVLNLGALFLYVFCGFIPEISRIGYYLSAGNIFLIPAVLKEIPDKKQKLFFCGAVAAAFSAYFIMSLITYYEIDIRLLPYASWFV